MSAPPPASRVILVRYSPRVIRQQLVVSGTARPCVSCDAPVLWIHTNAGRAMPVDAEADRDGTYHAHFTTCPQARAWSRGRQGGRR